MSFNISFDEDPSAQRQKAGRFRKVFLRVFSFGIVILAVDTLVRQFLVSEARIPIVISFVSGYLAVEVFNYLQTDRRDLLIEAERLAARKLEAVKENAYSDLDISGLKDEINAIRSEVQAIQAGGANQLESLIASVSASALKNVSEDVINRVHRDVENLSDYYSARHALELSAISRNRLEISLDRLSRRGNTNLAIGTFVMT